MAAVRLYGERMVVSRQACGLSKPWHEPGKKQVSDGFMSTKALESKKSLAVVLEVRFAWPFLTHGFLLLYLE